ncbi:hypothetical protein, partial [Achromobacter ruhlandii]|uniref:hypothetical protein n=1 Tax=Achromobacter ruhlandii TaxID=72557 RepID=UPI001C2E733C
NWLLPDLHRLTQNSLTAGSRESSLTHRLAALRQIRRRGAKSVALAWLRGSQNCVNCEGARL